jgi:hypothetical protein
MLLVSESQTADTACLASLRLHNAIAASLSQAFNYGGLHVSTHQQFETEQRDWQAAAISLCPSSSAAAGGFEIHRTPVSLRSMW